MTRGVAAMVLWAVLAAAVAVGAAPILTTDSPASVRAAHLLPHTPASLAILLHPPLLLPSSLPGYALASSLDSLATAPITPLNTSSAATVSVSVPLPIPLPPVSMVIATTTAGADASAPAAGATWGTLAPTTTTGSLAPFTVTRINTPDAAASSSPCAYHYAFVPSQDNPHSPTTSLAWDWGSQINAELTVVPLATASTLPFALDAQSVHALGGSPSLISSNTSALAVVSGPVYVAENRTWHVVLETGSSVDRIASVVLEIEGLAPVGVVGCDAVSVSVDVTLGASPPSPASASPSRHPSVGATRVGDPCHPGVVVALDAGADTLDVSYDYGGTWSRIEGAFPAAARPLTDVAVLDGHIVVVGAGSELRGWVLAHPLGSSTFNATLAVDLGAGATLGSRPGACVPPRLLAADDFPANGLVVRNASAAVVVTVGHGLGVMAVPSPLSSAVDVVYDPLGPVVLGLEPDGSLTVCPLDTGSACSVSAGRAPGATRVAAHSAAGMVVAYGGSKVLLSWDRGGVWTTGVDGGSERTFSTLLVSRDQTSEFVAVDTVGRMVYGAGLSDTTVQVGALPPDAVLVHMHGVGSLRMARLNATGESFPAYVPLLAFVGSQAGVMDPVGSVRAATADAVLASLAAAAVPLAMPGSRDVALFLGPLASGTMSPNAWSPLSLDVTGVGNLVVRARRGGAELASLGTVMSADWTPSSGPAPSLADMGCASGLGLSSDGADAVTLEPVEHGLVGSSWATRTVHAVAVTVTPQAGCAWTGSAGDVAWIDAGRAALHVLSSSSARVFYTDATVSPPINGTVLGGRIAMLSGATMWPADTSVPSAEASASLTFACVSDAGAGAVVTVTPALPVAAAAGAVVVVDGVGAGALLDNTTLALPGPVNCSDVVGASGGTRVSLGLFGGAPETLAAASCTASSGAASGPSTAVLDMMDEVEVDGASQVVGGGWVTPLSVSSSGFVRAGSSADASVSLVRATVGVSSSNVVELGCIGATRGTWVQAGCPATKQLSAWMAESEEGLASGAVTAYGIPVNYRPPSWRGLAIPLTDNFYNSDPSRPRHRNMFSVSKRSGKYNACAGAGTRSECGCAYKDTVSPRVAVSDCLAVVPQLQYSELFVPVFAVTQSGSNRTVLQGRILISEVNGRTDWCTNSSRCDDQSEYEATAGVQDAIIWGGPELYHFRITVLDDTYCRLETEIALWIVDPPLQFLQLWSVITVTFVSLALGLLVLYGWHKWRTR